MYKVVREENGKYHSYWARGYSMVEYKIGQWATAPGYLAKSGYYLTYFPYLKDVKSFWHCYGLNAEEGFKIFAIQIKRKQKILPPIRTQTQNDMAHMALHLPCIKTWPPGTRMAKEIMLLEEVKDV